MISPVAEKALLLALGAVAIYACLIPVRPGAGPVPPDLVFCLVVAWAVRSPRATPLWLVLLLGLAADVMLNRPLGLGALGLVLATEAIRARAGRLQGTPFVLEWAAAVALFALALAGSSLLLRLTLADEPGPAAMLGHLVATAIAYPVVAAALAWGLRLGPARPAAPHPALGRLR